MSKSDKSSHLWKTTYFRKLSPHKREEAYIERFVELQKLKKIDLSHVYNKQWRDRARLLEDDMQVILEVNQEYR